MTFDSRLMSMLLAFLLFAIAQPVQAQNKLGSTDLNVPATLVAESQQVQAGQSVTLAFVMTPKPTWHGYWENPGDVTAPNGESWNEVCLRVGAEVNQLCRDYAGRDIVVVAHYGVILTQIQRAGGMSAKAAISFHIDNLSVTRLEHLGSAWRIMGVNHKP